LITEKNNQNDSKSCHCKNLEETIDKHKDTINKKFNNAKSSAMKELTKNTNLRKYSNDKNWNNKVFSNKRIKPRHKQIRKDFNKMNKIKDKHNMIDKNDNYFEKINNKYVNIYKISDDKKFSNAETSMEVEDLHPRYSSVNENLNFGVFAL